MYLVMTGATIAGRRRPADVCASPLGDGSADGRRDAGRGTRNRRGGRGCGTRGRTGAADVGGGHREAVGVTVGEAGHGDRTRRARRRDHGVGEVGGVAGAHRVAGDRGAAVAGRSGEGDHRLPVGARRRRSDGGSAGDRRGDDRSRRRARSTRAGGASGGDGEGVCVAVVQSRDGALIRRGPRVVVRARRLVVGAARAARRAREVGSRPWRSPSRRAAGRRPCWRGRSSSPSTGRSAQGVADTPVGAVGAPTKMAAVAGDGTLVASALVAVTWKVYWSPLVRPGTVHESVGPSVPVTVSVHVSRPGHRCWGRSRARTRRWRSPCTTGSATPR